MTQSNPQLRIGVLGAGNMGAAIIRGLLATGKFPLGSIAATDVAAERLNELASEYGFEAVSTNRSLVHRSNVVILAVKPQTLPKILAELDEDTAGNRLFISIAAGVTIEAIERALPKTSRVVRTMPNTPAVALAAVTAIARGSKATSDDMETATLLFESIGRVVEVEESMLDAVTGLSGSGPAYALLVIEAMADGGVRMGLPRQTALLLAAQTLYGTAKMVLTSKLHPAQLRDNVTSPGGTTIAGLSALEQGAARFAFVDAVTAATRRSIELGQATVKK